MFAHQTILHRLRRGCETNRWPDGPPPSLPERHGGALRVEANRCADNCDACVSVCPTSAITRPKNQSVNLDLGRCIFCTECVATCPSGAITQTGDFRMATRRREDLQLG